MKVWAPVLLLVILLSACGDETPVKKPDPTEPTTPSPTVPALDGVFAPESLSSFRCTLNKDKKSWSAVGIITNAEKTAASYQLTVYVGDVGSSGQGRTEKYPNVQPKGSVRAQVNQIPGPGDEAATCNAQLVRLK